MKLFRNAEVRRGLLFWCLLSGCFTGMAFMLLPEFGLLAAGFSFAFVGAWFFLTWQRYRRLQDLCLEIDRILHGKSHFDLSRFAEGELSILYSELYKMTVRLKEQADSLQKDKLYLADSLADISHQIRTPLTSIHLIANFLLEDDLPKGRQKALARDLSQLLSRIDWLIATLLKMSKLDTGTVQMEKKEVPIRQIVEKAAEPIAIPMDLKNQRLAIEASGKECFQGDAAWTTEAIGNILKNCMEHTPEGGTLTVEVRETPLFAELAISDTGAGFAPEDLPHLFERFYKGKNAAKNSVGIGLALAKMIIVAQDGTIKAENGKQGGAKFTLRFYKTAI